MAIAILLATNSAQGQTLLRWKLKTGDSLLVETTQQTQSQVDFSGKSAVTKVDLVMQLRWQVKDADEKAIDVKQTIDQVRATLTTPAGSAEFDSAAKTRSTGLAKQLAQSLQPLVGAEIEVVFTLQGEVQSAKPVNEAAQKLFADEDAKTDDWSPAPRSSLAQLVSQSILPLPDKAVNVGDAWTKERQFVSAAGTLKQDATYTLEDVTEQDGSSRAKIKTSGRLIEESKPGQSSAKAIRIVSHEQTGSAVFSIDEGRPIEVAQTQLLKTQRTYREATIDVSLNSHTKTTFRADSAKK